jgi:PBP1b-binding outer membrane lipoprotein LpoB
MTTQTLNKLASSCLAAGAVTLLLAGCASPTGGAKYVDTNSGRTVLSTDRINMQDWNTAAEDLIKKMQDEFINSGKLQSADGPGQPSVLAISRIVNDTGLQIDTDMLVKRIRIALHQTGKVYTDVTVGHGGPEDLLIDAWKRQQIFQSGGKVRPPDYTLSGKIMEDRQRAGSIREVTYVFQLSLASINGLAVWEGEKRITKQGNKPSVRW